MVQPVQPVQPIVSFRGVSYEVGGRRVLDGFDLDVAAGETVMLLGRSGSGKTTALRLVNALLRPTSGEVLVEGVATTAWDPIRLRRRIGYVIQEVGLFPHYTVAENVGLVPRLEGWDPARVSARVGELLALVGLTPSEFRSRRPHELSGGQRQRVGVARALAASPSLLLFDEPFGAVDPVTRLELQREFAALRKRLGTSALFVTHDVGEALALGTRVALLHAGRLELVAPPLEFLRSHAPEARRFVEVLEQRMDGSEAGAP
jgi:osmoprotectant transport system ATP-binding protein